MTPILERFKQFVNKPTFMSAKGEKLCIKSKYTGQALSLDKDNEVIQKVVHILEQREHNARKTVAKRKKK